MHSLVRGGGIVDLMWGKKEFGEDFGAGLIDSTVGYTLNFVMRYYIDFLTKHRLFFVLFTSYFFFTFFPFFCFA